MATGLVQTVWVLQAIRSRVEGIEANLDWASFKRAANGLFPWEAFVSAEAKGQSHSDDAMIAAERFADAMPDPLSINAISEPAVHSLIGAAIRRSRPTSSASSMPR